MNDYSASTYSVSKHKRIPRRVKKRLRRDYEHLGLELGRMSKRAWVDLWERSVLMEQMHSYMKLLALPAPYTPPVFVMPDRHFGDDYTFPTLLKFSYSNRPPPIFLGDFV